MPSAQAVGVLLVLATSNPGRTGLHSLTEPVEYSPGIHGWGQASPPAQAKPAAHGEQVVRVPGSGSLVPGGHLTGSLEGEGHLKPGGHTWQVAPLAAGIIPDEHVVHAVFWPSDTSPLAQGAGVAAVLAQKYPTGQIVQLVLPELAAYVPAGHSEQNVDELAEKEPAEHATGLTAGLEHE